MHDPLGKVLPPTSSPTIIDTWLSMQSLLQTHKSQLRSIGVSNFSIKTFTQLVADERVTVIPATNQVELHPYLPQTALKEYCEQKGIILTAYSPLGAYFFDIFHINFLMTTSSSVSWSVIFWMCIQANHRPPQVARPKHHHCFWETRSSCRLLRSMGPHPPRSFSTGVFNVGPS